MTEEYRENGIALKIDRGVNFTLIHPSMSLSFFLVLA